MTAAADKCRVQRITLLLGDGASTRSALELLPMLVEAHTTELYGLFVEDIDLLRLAQIPFTRELCRLTCVERPLLEEDIERQLRIQARSARLSLEASAKQTGLSYSFRTIRGTIALLLQEAAREMDLVVLAPPRRARQLPGSITLTTVACQPGKPLVVTYDGSQSSDRALLLAKRLAQSGKRELVVLLPSEAEEDGLVLSRRAAEKLFPLTARYCPSPKWEIGTLLQSSRKENASMLVLGVDDRLLRPDNLQALSKYLECPVLLVN